MNTQFSFTIHGNQENKQGNALPKLRLTQRSLWTEKAIRYFAWGDYVRLCFHNKYPFKNAKPFNKTFVGRMDLKIYWANEHHGDAEGIFGSIADALFENDKHLDGSFTQFHENNKNPRVEVFIELNRIDGV